MANGIMQATVVSLATPDPSQKSMRLALYDSTGAALNVGKQVAARVDVAAATSTAAAGSTPTKAEFDALRNDYLALRTAFNDLLAKMRTAGVLA